MQRAVFAGRKLRLRYASRGEEPRWRTVDPLGVVDAGGQWYLLGTHDGAERTYRLSRVHEVEELAQAAQRGGDLDLERVWEELRARFRALMPQLSVQVRAREQARAQLEQSGVAVEAEQRGDIGWARLELRFADLAHATGVLWSLGPDVEVLEPPALRTAIGERARATARHYDRLPLG